MLTDQHVQTLRSINSIEALLEFVRRELSWPIENEAIENVTYEFQPEELGLKEEHFPKINSIRQLRPPSTDQPWGIFFIDFENKKIPVTVMRRILNHLAVKRRSDRMTVAGQAWNPADLMFLTTYGEEYDGMREVALAHFHETPGDLPSLRVLDWHAGDSPTKLKQTYETLKSNLAWPENPADADGWRGQWSSPFKHKPGHVITTSKELADAMAVLSRRIRAACNELLESETDKGPLTKLYKAFKEALIHDLKPDDFADTFAQTITYGLLTAAISRTDHDQGKKGTALLTEDVATLVPITNPFLKEILETFLDVGGRKKAGMDFDELGVQDVVELLRGEETDLPAIIQDFGNRKAGEDPVIHFYEDYLKAYNKELKVKRGVFYTPQPVVSYIVRSVHELLQTEFGLEDGLASTITWAEMVAKDPEIKIPEIKNIDGKVIGQTDPDSHFVTILDPATGTATFLVEVIDVIWKHLQEKFKRDPESCWKMLGQNRTPEPPNSRTFSQFWNAYVPDHLLPRMYGYELMMAPYAIAHMKIGLKLGETGYSFGTDRRVRIYLTNALEPASELQARLALDWEALAHEAMAVKAVKETQRFTVVIGNPPYSIDSGNMSGPAKALVDQFREIDGVKIRERGALKMEVILQDDYVKFLGLSRVLLGEASIGILGMITNANFFLNPVLRGVRFNVCDFFTRILALDLGGQSKAQFAQDANVFEIDTSVAITIASKVAGAGSAERKVGSMRGSREDKYDRLSRSTAVELCEHSFDASPDQFLIKNFGTEHMPAYMQGIRIDQAFRVTSIGIKTARDHLVTDLDKEQLVERIESLRDLGNSPEELRERYEIDDNTQWKFTDALPRFRSTFSESNFEMVEAKPFDTRWIYYHPSVVFSHRPGVNRNVRGHSNVCFLTTRRIRTSDFAHVFVTNRLALGEMLSTADNCNFFPVHLYHEDSLLPGERTTNLTPEFVKAMENCLGCRFDAENAPGFSTPLGCFGSEAVFHYIYAVLHSPTYRSRYAEFLKIDFPRIPLPCGPEVFDALVPLGAELVALHLVESPRLDTPMTRFVGSGVQGSGSSGGLDFSDDEVQLGPRVEKVTYTPKNQTVWIDKAQTQGFQGVPEEVWKFHIGGYQVCEKWLKDRGPKKGKPGRILTEEDQTHYQKIVVALSETIRIMSEIDQAIENHGGWPGAFQGSTDTGIETTNEEQE
jgi:hypothetical protein